MNSQSVICTSNILSGKIDNSYGKIGKCPFQGNIHFIYGVQKFRKGPRFALYGMCLNLRVTLN